MNCSANVYEPYPEYCKRWGTRKMSRNRNIAVFLDNEGRIIQVPKPNRTKIPLLAYLASKFEEGRNYTEKEVNNIINAWHTFNDYFILRRLLIDYGFLRRTPNGAEYWVALQDATEDKESEYIG